MSQLICSMIIGMHTELKWYFLKRLSPFRYWCYWSNGLKIKKTHIIALDCLFKPFSNWFNSISDFVFQCRVDLYHLSIRKLVTVFNYKLTELFYATIIIP